MEEKEEEEGVLKNGKSNEKEATDAIRSSTGPSAFDKENLIGGSDESGWFRIAPKEDSIRQEYRKRAAEHSDEVFLPPAITSTLRPGSTWTMC